MGLIKAAIILGAGGYALNKFKKSRDGHNCGCSHNHNDNRSQDPTDPSNTIGNNPNSSWTPGSRIHGQPAPEYRDEKSGWVARNSGGEKDGWVGEEKIN